MTTGINNPVPEVRRHDITSSVISDFRYSSLFALLDKPSKDRTALALMREAELAVRKTPVEELCLLVAALAAFVPAGSLGTCKQLARKRLGGEMAMWNDIHRRAREVV